MAAKKWDMAAAVASHLVKVQPENEDWCLIKFDGMPQLNFHLFNAAGDARIAGEVECDHAGGLGFSRSWLLTLTGLGHRPQIRGEYPWRSCV